MKTLAEPRQGRIKGQWFTPFRNEDIQPKVPARRVGMKLGLVVLASLVCLCACKSPEDKAKEAEAHYSHGMELMKKSQSSMNDDDLAGAVAELREAVRLKPDDAKMHLMLGAALEHTHRVAPETVIAEYREAVRLKPNYAEAHHGLCSILGVKGDFDSAIAECREAIRLMPDDPEMHNLLGLMLDNKGDKQGALAETGKSLELRGEVLYAQGDYDGAMRKYHQAISFYGDAIRNYPEAKDPKQNGAVAHDKLGMALEKKGDLDGAIREYQEALDLNMNDADAHSNLGAALERKGDREGALREKRDAAEIKLGHELPPPPPPPPPPR